MLLLTKQKSSMRNLRLRSLRSIKFRCLLLHAVLVLVAVTNTYSSEENVRKIDSILIAHRGVFNPFDPNDWDCPTLRLSSIPHPDIIENTVPAVKKAFEAHADIVEIDLKVTKDRQVVVFHDDEVSCKTDGEGRVSELTLAQMRQLDLGFDYSTDNGKTFPFRGKGKGLLVTLEEMLILFPDRIFFLNPKDHEPSAGKVLGETLSKFKGKRNLNQFLFWGNDAVYGALKKILPEYGLIFPTPFQRPTCYPQLEGWSWFGYMPEPCRNLTLNLGPEYWKQPFFFNLLKLAKIHNSKVVLWSVNTRRDYIGLNGLVPYIMTSAITEIGQKYTPLIN